MLTKYEWCIVPDTTLLSQSEPNKWLHLSSEIQSSRFSSMDFPQTMVKLVHKNCTFFRCKSGCTRWREAVYERYPSLRPRSTYGTMAAWG
ncbi:hypothetical protein FA13DRAFT_1739818 [Coprinellus micaceus]|uniref:Uncharacterized protein n=1 Tax=Coprinellus micaceus TaxID=71717 RepID=A0A4Y7SPD7_COPMI|nr:hypothetical protein FA13DRAFT_1739818 [Coprinellus micaceus]